MSSYAEAQEQIREAAENQAEVLHLSDLDKFPPELFELECLRSLNLHAIMPREVVPSELSQLSNLQSLWLSGYAFKTLPQMIYNLTNLRELVIIDCDLIGFSPEIAQLTELRGLFVEFNWWFEELPPEIGRLVHLEELVINACRMRAFTPEICQLTNLRKLWLSGNGLQALPAEIGQLTNLQLLDLNRNQLENIPPEIDQLTDPDLALDLSRNQIGRAHV